MRRLSLSRTFAFVLAPLLLAGAEPKALPPALVCSGGPPAWRFQLSGRQARLSLPNAPEIPLRGGFSPMDVDKAYGWRGRPAEGKTGEVVAFVSEATCADAVRGDQPYEVRLSLPDGRFLAGCCRVGSAPDRPEPTPEPTPTPMVAPTPAPSEGDWTASLITFLPSIKACVLARAGTEAVVFAAVRPDKVVHLVLRLPDERYADCDLPPGRGPATVTLRPKGADLAAEEQAALLILLPRPAPSEGCFRSQLTNDEQGNPYAWISRRGC
ncbi:MAG TPA: hypothetical protein VMV21_12190 [Vicinamibacteria bacterium]|nr:hypothetical protein [Vicinamibacteria bacterium]